MPDVIIIGWGAAGMMAGIAAAEEGRDVLIVEKNKIVGKKWKKFEKNVKIY